MDWNWHFLQKWLRTSGSCRFVWSDILLGVQTNFFVAVRYDFLQKCVHFPVSPVKRLPWFVLCDLSAVS